MQSVGFEPTMDVDLRIKSPLVSATYLRLHLKFFSIITFVVSDKISSLTLWTRLFFPDGFFHEHPYDIFCIVFSNRITQHHKDFYSLYDVVLPVLYFHRLHTVDFQSVFYFAVLSSDRNVSIHVYSFPYLQNNT